MSDFFILGDFYLDNQEIISTEIKFDNGKPSLEWLKTAVLNDCVQICTDQGVEFDGFELSRSVRIQQLNNRFSKFIDIRDLETVESGDRLRFLFTRTPLQQVQYLGLEYSCLVYKISIRVSSWINSAYTKIN